MTSDFKKVLMPLWYEKRNRMWTLDLTGFLLPAILFLNHYIPGKSWMYKALICGCKHLSTSATLLIWSRSAFYLSSFINGTNMTQGHSIWPKGLCWDISVPLCCSDVGVHKHVAVTDYCWSIVLTLGWQGRWSNLCWLGPQWKRKLIKITLHLSWSESMCGKEQHLRPDYALQLAHLQQFVWPCSLTEIFNIIKFKREKGSNYTHVYSLCR